MKIPERKRSARLMNVTGNRRTRSSNPTQENSKRVYTETFKPGQKVFARWIDRKRYEAKVIREEELSVTVQFTEDKTECTLKKHLVTPLEMKTSKRRKRETSPPALATVSASASPTDSPALATDSPALANDFPPALATDSPHHALATDSPHHALATDFPPAITTNSPSALATDSPSALANDSPPAIATDSPPALETDSPPAIATDSPPALATDSPPAIATDSPPALETNSPPAIATDSPPAIATNSPSALATDSPLALVFNSTSALQLIQSYSSSEDSCTVDETYQISSASHSNLHSSSDREYLKSFTNLSTVSTSTSHLNANDLNSVDSHSFNSVDIISSSPSSVDDNVLHDREYNSNKILCSSKDPYEFSDNGYSDSENSYIPMDSTPSSLDSNSFNDKVENNLEMPSTSRSTNTSYKLTDSEIFKSDTHVLKNSTSNYEKPPTYETNKTKNITVVGSTSTRGKRIWSKKYYCPFCDEKSFLKLPRHMEGVHKNESEVGQILSTSDSKLRRKLFCKLRNIGNHQHNIKVLKEGHGELMVVYRPPKGVDVDPHNYIPCPTCYGYYSKRELWKHKCLFKEKVRNERVVAASRKLLPMFHDVNEDVRQLLCEMHQDEITAIAKGDAVILEFIRRMYSVKGGHQDHRKGEIRNSAREISRFLKAYREKTQQDSCCMKEIIDTSNYKTIIETVGTVAKLDQKSQKIGIPELARKLGQHINMCAIIVQSFALEDNNRSLLDKIENFLKLHKLNYFTEIGAMVQRNKKEMKRNAKEEIPISEDIMKLNNHLKCVISKNLEVLNQENNEKETIISSWTALQKAILTQIMVFNRRREGEISRIKMKDYLEIKGKSENSSLGDILTKTEKALCKILWRMEIQGKCDRNVPVLLTSDMKTCIDMLIKWRNFVGVMPENQYLFASCYRGARLHYRGSACLKKFAEDSGVSRPKTLQSTKLRKHVATLAQILNLKDFEMDALATFMGHDIRIHRKYYRIPDNIYQLSKLSRLFISLDKGQLHKNAGKTLDQIDAEFDENKDESADEPGGDKLGNFTDLDSESGSPMPEAKISKDSVSEIDDPNYTVSNEEQQKAISSEDSRSESESEWTSQSKAKTKPSSKSKTSGVRKFWSQQEKDAVERHFLSHILLLKLPGADNIRECLKKEPALAQRTWKNVKDYCRNRITTIKRKQSI